MLDRLRQIKNLFGPWLTTMATLQAHQQSRATPKRRSGKAHRPWTKPATVSARVHHHQLSVPERHTRRRIRNLNRRR